MHRRYAYRSVCPLRTVVREAVRSIVYPRDRSSDLYISSAYFHLRMAQQPGSSLPIIEAAKQPDGPSRLVCITDETASSQACPPIDGLTESRAPACS